MLNSLISAIIACAITSLNLYSIIYWEFNALRISVLTLLIIAAFYCMALFLRDSENNKIMEFVCYGINAIIGTLIIIFLITYRRATVFIILTPAFIIISILSIIFYFKNH